MFETGKYAWEVLKTALRFKELTPPSNIPDNTIALYAKDLAGTSALFYKDDADVEHDLSGGITGSGANTQVAYWTAATVLAGAAAFTFTVGTGLLSSTLINAATGFRVAGAASSGNVLKGNGTNFVSAAPGDLTKADDTNVTLTLGGTPTGALLNATSLTLGWTGQLAASRGGTGVSSLGNVTAASTKITLAGTPTGAAIQSFSIDVNQANLDHGSIGGLTDDDHTGYALLAGRSGGQTLKGGTDSGDDLTLMSTNHATKGSILFGSSAYDEVNDRLGIGLTSPDTPLHIFKTGVAPVLRVVGEWDTASMNSQLDLRSYSGSSANSGGVVRGMGIRGTVGTPTATQSGDVLLQLAGDGYTNALTTSGQGLIRIEASDTWAAGSAPTRIGLYATPPSTVTPINTMRVMSSGVTVVSNGATMVDPSAALHLISGSDAVSAFQLENTAGGANGPTFVTYANSGSPADNDAIGTWNAFFKDDGGNVRQGHAILLLARDVTSTTMDSDMLFATMDNVNAAGVNTFASLSSVGVWTDASDEEGKTFEGRISNVLEKIKQLRVEQYRSSRVSGSKLATAERHISPTAQDFEAVIGIPTTMGLNPYTKRPLRGIAPKDLAGLALMGIQDLIARVEKLEAA